MKATLYILLVSLVLTSFSVSAHKLKFISADRFIGLEPISPGQLLKYVGDYESSGMTVQIVLRNGKSLYLIAPGQPDYELEYKGNHVFSNKLEPNYFAHFGVNQQGKVTTLSTIQSNGRFILIRKIVDPVTSAKNLL